MYTLIIMKFEWDLKKEALNIKKHNVAFSEAASVFFDDNAIAEFDLLHSNSEDKFKVIGFSSRLNLLFVVFVERDKKSVRIISARKATKSERTKYEEKNR